MDARTFLILGGYGLTGICLAKLLLQETDLRLVLAGRNLEKAQAAAGELNAAFEGERVSARRVDASDPESLRQGFQEVDFVLVASSTAVFVREVASAALEAGIDYLDIHYSNRKAPLLNPMAPEIEKAGRCFITEAGFHPGLPAALVRYIAPRFDRLDSANISSVINQEGGLPMSDSIYEFVEEIKDYKCVALKNGQWVEKGMPNCKVDFGGGFGMRMCVAMDLEEMHALPSMIPSLKETGFYVAGFNWFVDWFLFPLMMVIVRLSPKASIRPMAKLLHWSLKRFGSPPYGLVLKLEARGENDGRPEAVDLTLFHEDGYTFTAIPVVACLLQYLDGTIQKPGLHLMGLLADPDRLVADMRRMGIEMREG